MSSPFTVSITLSPKLLFPIKPPKVATKTKTINPTIMVEPVEFRFFLIFEIADIFPKKNAPLRRVFYYIFFIDNL